MCLLLLFTHSLCLFLPDFVSLLLSFLPSRCPSHLLFQSLSLFLSLSLCVLFLLFSPRWEMTGISHLAEKGILTFSSFPAHFISTLMHPACALSSLPSFFWGYAPFSLASCSCVRAKGRQRSPGTLLTISVPLSHTFAFPLQDHSEACRTLCSCLQKEWSLICLHRLMSLACAEQLLACRLLWWALVSPSG